MAKGGRSRSRLDAELVRRGLVATRQLAQDAIAQGRVLVSGAQAERASRLVDPAEPVELLGPGPRFVGRGGEKLAGALTRFELDVSGRSALDAGASTGGFTDCLLQYGAARVVALDVGHGQLHPKLRHDPRVAVIERTNVRELTVERLDQLAGAGTAPVDLVTADLSFISLTSVVPVLAGPLLRPGGPLLLLVKPQFEVGRVAVSRGRGVIRDPELWAEALEAVASSLRAAGAAIIGAMPSSLLGTSGNTEFVLYASGHAAQPGTPAGTTVPSAAVALTALLAAAVAEAAERAEQATSAEPSGAAPIPASTTGQDG